METEYEYIRRCIHYMDNDYDEECNTLVLTYRKINPIYWILWIKIQIKYNYVSG